MIITDSYLRGKGVYSPAGKRIGKIRGLALDIPSGRVTYLLVEFDRLPNLIENECVLPWALLRYDKRLKGFRTEVTELQLSSAPRFYDDRAWEEAVHLHYNARPYWIKPSLPRERYRLPMRHLDLLRNKGPKIEH
jgi:sporulation protein YlmC with PRC-barrel domain